MPGTRITHQQVTIYMSHRKRHSQVIAAAKAGISERSARRIDKQNEQQTSNKRQWRTCKDPLEAIWESIVVPLLQDDETLMPVGIFDHLCELHTDKWLQNRRLVFSQRLLETTKLSIPQVAEQAGFGADSVFRKHFKSTFHVSPVQWRTTFKQ